MPKLTTAIRRFSLLLAVLALVVTYPLQAFAEDSGTAPAPATGPTQPSGADSKTYTYNAATGMWENDHYIWNPATNQTTPKDAQTYSYNPTTGHWDTTTWAYDAPSGKYAPNEVSVAQPPAAASISDTGPASTNTINNNGSGGTGGSAISNTGPSSNNNIGNTGSSTGVFDNFFNGSISTKLTSNATSGDALVVRNTNAGNSSTGNAQAVANLINTICNSPSACNLQGGSLATFNKDIYGNVQGDLMLDPSQLGNFDTSVANGSGNNNLTINSKSSGQINNDISLNAKSGDASVSGNTRGGDATSGDAKAVADIVNVINSLITSGQSFLGAINIYGSLDGDILLPQDSLNKLLASNSIDTTGPSSNNQINTSGTNNTNVKNNVDTAINNDVSLNALSGDANVSHNTQAGSATTGQADTNLTILNLTGQQVIGDDALLVFVNVMGKWVGMIVNAPAGSTSAALGGGISSLGSLPGNNDTTINNTVGNSINNKLNVNAASGNANVTNNTLGGNAKSGNTNASANILNVSNTTLALNKWLGILFINVFGSWNGSFGINTAAGNPANVASSAGGPSNNSVAGVKVFRFVPTASSSSDSKRAVLLASATGPNNVISNTGPGSHNSVALAANNTNKPSPPSQSSDSHRKSNLMWTAGSLFFLAGILGAEGTISSRKAGRAKFRSHLNSITVPPLKRY